LFILLKMLCVGFLIELPHILSAAAAAAAAAVLPNVTEGIVVSLPGMNGADI
jgi:hypothetical protein